MKSVCNMALQTRPQYGVGPWVLLENCGKFLSSPTCDRGVCTGGKFLNLIKSLRHCSSPTSKSLAGDKAIHSHGRVFVQLAKVRYFNHHQLRLEISFPFSFPFVTFPWVGWCWSSLGVLYCFVFPFPLGGPPKLHKFLIKSASTHPYV